MGAMGRFRRHIEDVRQARMEGRREAVKAYAAAAEKHPETLAKSRVPLWLLQQLRRATEQQTRNVFSRNTHR